LRRVFPEFRCADAVIRTPRPAVHGAVSDVRHQDLAYCAGADAV